MMNKTLIYILCIILSSCIRQTYSLYIETDDDNGDNSGGGTTSTPYDAVIYLYPYDKEVQNATAEVTIKLKKPVNDNISADIPVLKYNKSWLMLLTQDDCMQSAFCRTWAAINGRAISSSQQYPTPTEENPNKTRDLYYDIEHVQYNDLPPNVFSFLNTLGMTNGTGQEVRFGFTTTLAPEESTMDVTVSVRPGFTENLYRFYRESYLRWNNIREMMNYGVAIAFHDVKADNVRDAAEIKSHIAIAQSIISDKLSGRQCKMMAEPNGNKTYLEAAIDYGSIYTMTSQGNMSETLYPSKLTRDNIDKAVWSRVFYNSIDDIKAAIKECLSLNKDERNAICIGMHNTSDEWSHFAKWVDDNYGKEGDDSVWFTSQEEFYEYSYYRLMGGAPKVEKITDLEYRVTVNLPSKGNFYYPSVTVNLPGIDYDNIDEMKTDDAVTGFSYGKYNDGVMLNIDCRRYLKEMAEHYVEVYEKDKSNATSRIDAQYFVNMLKPSEDKVKLLERCNYE